MLSQIVRGRIRLWDGADIDEICGCTAAIPGVSAPSTGGIEAMNRGRGGIRCDRVSYLVVRRRTPVCKERTPERAHAAEKPAQSNCAHRAPSVVNLASACGRSRRNVKSANSNPGATVQPASAKVPRGTAACQ